MATTAPVTGTVTAFDEARGLGTVSPDTPAVPGGPAGGSLTFHCTAITDGSRTIEVGTRVAYLVAPTHRGASEARAVTALSAGAA